MEQLIPWFSLKRVPGVGNLLFKRLMDRFQSPESVFAASTDALLSVEGMHRRLTERIRRHRVSDTVMAELERVHTKGYRIITYADSDYPPLLREIPDPPPYVYVSGTLQPWTNTIAVVGTPAEVGQQIAARFGGKVERISPVIYQPDVSLLAELRQEIAAAV